MPDMVTIDQVRDLIKSEKLRPSDLFGTETLTADPIVKGYAEDRVKERIGGEFARRKEAEEKLEKIEEKHKEETTKLQEENKTLKLGAAKSQVGTLFEKQKAERKLTERQIKWLTHGENESRIAKFSPDKIEDVEKEFNTYLDAEIDAYNKAAKDVFGIEPEAGKKDAEGGKDNKAAGGAEPDENKSAPVDDKYLDPSQNPMIKLA